MVWRKKDNQEILDFIVACWIEKEIVLWRKIRETRLSRRGCMIDIRHQEHNYQINMGVLSEKTRECLFLWFLYVHQHRHNHWLKWFFYWRTSGRKLIKRFLTLYCAHLENHIITVAPSTQSSQVHSNQVCFISLHYCK